MLALTGADAVMVGRAAQGRPWIFREIAHFLATGTHLAPPLVAEVRRLLLDHLQEHYALYGDYSGVRTARKHIGWYVRALPGGEAFRGEMNAIEDCDAATARGRPTSSTRWPTQHGPHAHARPRTRRAKPRKKRRRPDGPPNNESKKRRA